MHRYIITAILSLAGFAIQAQDFKSDNVRYLTISWTEFFKKLDQNPKLVYYDIRSDGERNDNGKSAQYNQGKIRGAIETDFSDFAKYYPEYLKHKGDTIYLYCSHSKRSRFLAKQLRDSSFLNVVNINGGLSYLNTLPEKEMHYKSKYYTNNLKYKLTTPTGFIEALDSKKYQIIDVRPDSLHFGEANNERGNSFGTIQSAIHIPYDRIQDNLKQLDKDKTILLFDNEGDLGPIAAEILIQKGYKTSVLLFGLGHLIATKENKDRTFLKTKYKMILPAQLLETSKQKNTVIVDIRTTTEYTGTDTNGWKNAGRLKNAINIPLALLSKEKMHTLSGKAIVIYDRMMKEEVFEFAKRLKEYGISDFHILIGGLSRLKEEVYDFQKTDLKRLLDE